RRCRRRAALGGDRRFDRRAGPRPRPGRLGERAVRAARGPRTARGARCRCGPPRLGAGLGCRGGVRPEGLRPRRDAPPRERRGARHPVGCGRMEPMTYTLVLLRHGESEWNAKNLFTGWVDVPLSEKGAAEARRGGTLLTDAGVLPDVVHTSLLRRAITTANLTLDAADRHWIPVKRSWRLNERHYGALQGKDKKQTLAEFGEEQFMLWRRSYDTP